MGRQQRRDPCLLVLEASERRVSHDGVSVEELANKVAVGEVVLEAAHLPAQPHIIVEPAPEQLGRHNVT